MGLDMYLEKRTLVKDQIVREEVGYWRKANAIHQWFVDNVQDGNDDCEAHYVSPKQLKSLLKRVQTVLKHSKLVPGRITNGYRLVNGEWQPQLVEGRYIKDATVAKKLLPTTEGFFFGSTDYDQWYHDDLRATVKILEAALADPGEYYYQSSW